MEEVEDEVTAFVKKSCLVAGLPFWNNYNGFKKWTRIAWFSYIYLHWIIFIVVTMSMFVKFCLEYDDVDIACTSIMGSFYLLQFSCKMTFLLKKQKEFTEVFEGMAQVSFDLKAYDEYEKIKRYFFNPLRKIGKIKMIAEGTGVTLYLFMVVLARLITGKHIFGFPAPLWAPHPVDVTENPAFSVSYILVIFGYALAVVKTSLLDILVLLFFVISLSQLRYLRISLKNAFVGEQNLENKGEESDVVEEGLKKKVMKEELLLLWVKRHQKVLR